MKIENLIATVFSYTWLIFCKRVGKIPEYALRFLKDNFTSENYGGKLIIFITASINLFYKNLKFSYK